MNPEKRYLEQARAHARQSLPADFANRVLRDATERRRRSDSLRLAMLTAAICLVTTVATHLMLRAETNSANLAKWNQTHQEVIALEEGL
jgi:hypothetical protein